jgi:hypothetical protein
MKNVTEDDSEFEDANIKVYEFNRERAMYDQSNARKWEYA